MAISAKWCFHYDIGYNNKLLAAICMLFRQHWGSCDLGANPTDPPSTRRVAARLDDLLEFNLAVLDKIITPV
jgi:hypothetical protein